MVKKSPPPSSSPALPSTFDEAIAELDSIVSKMNAGHLPLEESVHAYERGTQLIQFCTQQLQKIEQQVKMFDAKNSVTDT